MNFSSIVLFILGIYQALDTRGSISEKGKNVLSIFLILIGGLPVVLNILFWFLGHGPKIQSLLDGILKALTLDYYDTVVRFLHLKGYGIYCSDKERKSYFHSDEKFYLGDIDNEFRYSNYRTWRLNENVSIGSCAPPGQIDGIQFMSDLEIFEMEFYLVFHFDPLFIEIDNKEGKYRIKRSYKNSTQNSIIFTSKENCFKISKILCIAQRKEIVTNVYYSNYRRCNIFHSCNIFYLIKYVEGRELNEIKISLINDLNGYVEDSLSELINVCSKTNYIKKIVGNNNFDILNDYCERRKLNTTEFIKWSYSSLKKRRIYKGVCSTSNFRNWEEKRLTVDFSEFCLKAKINMKKYVDKTIKVTKEMNSYLNKITDSPRDLKEIHSNGPDKQTIESVKGTKFEEIINKISKKELGSKGMELDLIDFKEMISSDRDNNKKNEILPKGNYYEALVKEIVKKDPNFDLNNKDKEDFKEFYYNYFSLKKESEYIREKLGILFKYGSLRKIDRESCENVRQIESTGRISRILKKEKYPWISNKESEFIVRSENSLNIDLNKNLLDTKPIKFLKGGKYYIGNRFGVLSKIGNCEENELTKKILNKVIQGDESNSKKPNIRGFREVIFSSLKEEKAEIKKGGGGSKKKKNNRSAQIIRERLIFLGINELKKEHSKNPKMTKKSDALFLRKRIPNEIMKENKSVLNDIIKNKKEYCEKRKSWDYMINLETTKEITKKTKKVFVSKEELTLSDNLKSNYIKFVNESNIKNTNIEMTKMGLQDKFSKIQNVKWNKENKIAKVKKDKEKQKNEAAKDNIRILKSESIFSVLRREKKFREEMKLKEIEKMNNKDAATSKN